MNVDNIKRALLVVLLSLTFALCGCGTSDTYTGKTESTGNGISASDSIDEGIANGGEEQPNNSSTQKPDEEKEDNSSTQKPDEEKEDNSSITESEKSEIEFPEITLP